MYALVKFSDETSVRIVSRTRGFIRRLCTEKKKTLKTHYKVEFVLQHRKLFL